MATRRKASAPSVGASGATPSVEQLVTMPQLATMPLVIKGWQWPDGSAARITVRALTFRERRAANRAAIKAGAELGRDFDDDEWALEVALAGIVEPRLTRAQLDILLDSNATIIDAIVDAIDRAGYLPARYVETELKQMAGESIPPAPAAPGADRQSE